VFLAALTIVAALVIALGVVRGVLPPAHPATSDWPPDTRTQHRQRS
jgi:hypothetical protein